MASVLTSLSQHSIAQLLESAVVQRAFEFFDSHADEITEDHIHISSIPAPPFGEHDRAVYLRRRFSELGLMDATLDEEGNCVAFRKGNSRAPLLVLSAHLDTVFPAGTDFAIHRAGRKLLAPGIADDGCGLAALLALAGVFQSLNIQTDGSLLFVGTVGEEGEGNLRGVKHLFTQGSWANCIDAFVSFDGAETARVTNGALGSRRYRVLLSGVGGHSWGDFGIVNPVNALGRAITKLASYPAPKEPRTTFNVGRIEGGSSINAIPRQATMDVDLRSESQQELLKLDAFFRRSVREAAEEENELRRSGERPLAIKVELIGERPSGETPADNDLVKLACEATKAVGITPQLNQASTDSNLPISLGIPAITVGAGGTSGNSHTLVEWYNPDGRAHGLRRALLIVLGTVGIAKNN